MNILNFNKFLSEINESKVNLPILDIVIGEDGTPYNGEESGTIIKGRVERTRGEITRILGTDNKEYPAGVDKNGNVVCLVFDEDGRALDFSGNPIKVPTWVQKNYKIPEYYYITTEFDYYTLIPIIPTGWVNVKIDMEVVKRVRRYAKTLGTNTKGHLSFIDKLTEFEKFSTQNRSEGSIKRLKRGTIQKEMACILLLHYINEIKDFFNPSQSGFIFESFIGGLIPNARIKEDNSPVDIRSTTGDRYQLKLMDWNTEYIEVTLDNEPSMSRYLDWYMIALKYVNKIELLIIDGSKLEEKVKGGTTGEILTKGGEKSGPKFKIKTLLTLNEPDFLKKFTIELSDIDGRIKNLGDSLKQNLDELYNELSEFQYNVETIVTGINERGQVIKDQSGFDVYHLKSEQNVKKLSEHLNNLVADINK